MGTFTNLLFHIIFTTKHRRPFITAEIQPRLYAYLGGIIRGERGTLYEIGGMPDHLHLFVRWNTAAPLAELLRKLKAESSGWLHREYPDLRDFAWQEGYAAFSVSQSQSPRVRQYILGQSAHHKRFDFRSEFIAFLKAHEVEYDARYLWD